MPSDVFCKKWSKLTVQSPVDSMHGVQQRKAPFHHALWTNETQKYHWTLAQTSGYTKTCAPNNFIWEANSNAPNNWPTSYWPFYRDQQQLPSFSAYQAKCGHLNAEAVIFNDYPLSHASNIFPKFMYMQWTVSITWPKIQNNANVHTSKTGFLAAFCIFFAEHIFLTLPGIVFIYMPWSILSWTVNDFDHNLNTCI